MKKYPCKNDVAVFLVFFNRPEPLKKVFESIREARPSKLFLCQDGPRVGNKNDIENVKKCRDIVSHIDWECDVYYDYSEENLGCGMRIFSGIKNAFNEVDKLIIIEDDIFVSQSFYPFCNELLEKYKDDQRIGLISGMNHLGVYKETNNDYFFSQSGSIWGWATWKRVWDQVEYDMPYIRDNDVMNSFRNSFERKRDAKILTKIGKENREILDSGGKLSFWSYQFGMASYLNNQINIIPKYNLISNIGLTEDSVHAVNDLRKIPKGLQSVFFAKTYDIDFPMKHTKYVINDKNYKRQVDIVMGNDFLRSKYRKVEGILRQLIFGDKDILSNKLKKNRKGRI